MLEHLRRYKGGSGALWRHYQNKLDPKGTSRESQLVDEELARSPDPKASAHSIMTQYEVIKNCEYILNAKWLAKVFESSPLWADKIEMHSWDGVPQGATIEVVKKLTYNGFELLGQDFDVLDTFKRDLSSKDQALLQTPQYREKDEVSKTEGFAKRRYSMQLNGAHQSWDAPDLPIYATNIE